MNVNRMPIGKARVKKVSLWDFTDPHFATNAEDLYSSDVTL